MNGFDDVSLFCSACVREGVKFACCKCVLGVVSVCVVVAGVCDML